MKNNRSTLIYWLSLIFKWRILIAKIVIICIAVSIIISLIIPPQYTAETTIMPPNPQQEALFGLMGIGISNRLTGLSGLSNILPGASTTSDLFAAILKSGRIMGNVIEKYNLRKVFKVKTTTDAYKTLSEITTIRVSPEGIVSVSVTWYNRQLAADIANSLVEELDRFNTEATMTMGKKYRLFVEKRLKETMDSLAKAEESLRKFQEQHRTVALDIEIENAIATIAKLKSEIILREVQKGAVASSSGFNNPFVANIDKELKELKKQLARIEFGTQDTTRKEFGAGFSVPFARLPELSLEYARLLRDVKIQEAVFELLTQQNEQAKIMEAKDTPTVQILDRAYPPEKKSIPKRGRIVILTGFFSLFLGIGFAFLKEYYELLKTQPAQFAKLTNIYNILKQDIQKLAKVFDFLKKTKSN
ncbi:MAG: Wzz/FepE/Etk N-terminal domain-containing protein [Patescibacteria group bacterium]|nr:Wzz/FepE/Etk N-terminal domain-containing protein [Patescibacteria group bacterium]